MQKTARQEIIFYTKVLREKNKERFLFETFGQIAEIVNI